jgi:hypothetical protein
LDGQVKYAVWTDPGNAAIQKSMIRNYPDLFRDRANMNYLANAVGETTRLVAGPDAYAETWFQSNKYQVSVYRDLRVRTPITTSLGFTKAFVRGVYDTGRVIKMGPAGLQVKQFTNPDFDRSYVSPFDDDDNEGELTAPRRNPRTNYSREMVGGTVSKGLKNEPSSPMKDENKDDEPDKEKLVDG